MNKKSVLILILLSLVLASAFQTVEAVMITSATSDKTTYLPGQKGYISVTVYNNQADSIRVTEITATIDHYYEDGTVYVQTFYTSEALPSEILVAQSETYQIPISLPVNIASGYVNPTIEVRTERWVSQELRWRLPERATDTNLKLYVESSTTLSNLTILLVLVTIVVAAAVAFLMYLVYTRKLRARAPLTIVPP